MQVFVANPNKNEAIVDILTSNKEKPLKYLGDFHTDKGECRALLDCFTGCEGDLMNAKQI